MQLYFDCQHLSGTLLSQKGCSFLFGKKISLKIDEMVLSGNPAFGSFFFLSYAYNIYKFRLFELSILELFLFLSHRGSHRGEIDLLEKNNKKKYPMIKM